MRSADKITANQRHFSLNCNGRLIDLTTPKVMGILNLTPDSFYAGSRSSNEKHAISQAEQMLAEGATFIDIGGMSSRPGAKIITSEEELQRILPTVKAIKMHLPQALLSIDTIYAETAKQCLDIGADCINDISAGKLDRNMLKTVGEYNIPFIAMHMKGTPQTMKTLANYDDLLTEITAYFIERTTACKQAGIRDMVIDVGFGFAKTVEQNFELLRRMNELEFLDYPILAGISRKSMIWRSLNITPQEALNGTTALHMVCLQNDAKILRAHDVKEATECIQLFSMLS